MQCHYLVPDPAACGALLAALTAPPRSASEPPQRLHRTVLDTFDCRLEGAGLVLEGCGAREGELEFELRGAGAPHGDGWRAAALPRDAGEVAPPRLRARLAALTAGRALLPRVATPVLRRRVHWRDALEKRIATLELDYHAPRRGVPALALLRLRPVRGFDRACQRTLASVRRTCRITPLTGDVTAALLAAHGAATSYRAKPVVALRPGGSALRALGALFEAYGGVMWANERGIVEDTDHEFLHDYRVALRSIRSWLDDLGKVVEKPVREHYRGELSTLNRLTGRLRDLDVLGENLPRYLETLGGTEPASARALLALVQAERAPARQEVARHLKGPRYRAFRRSWQDFARRLAAGEHGGKWGGRSLRDVVRRAVRRRLARVVDFDWGKADAEPAVLHELRKECKKLRYLLEGFQSLFDEASCRRAIRELKILQTAMGDTWDLHVHHALLAGLSASLPDDGELARGVLPIVAGLETRLAALERSHCELVSVAFARFRAPGVQRVYSRLLKDR